MATTCDICRHKKRLEIDRKLVNGVAITKVAKEFEVSYDILYQHNRKHITRQMMKAYEMREQENGLDLLVRVENMMVTLETLLAKAKSKNQDQKLLQVARELRNTYELLGKFQFAIRQEQAKQAENENNNAIGIQSEEIEQNLENLNQVEKDVYFAILQKLISGSDALIPNVRYETSDVTMPMDQVMSLPHSEERTSDSGPLKRTKKSPYIVKDIEPTQIPSSKSHRIRASRRG